MGSRIENYETILKINISYNLNKKDKENIFL